MTFSLGFDECLTVEGERERETKDNLGLGSCVDSGLIQWGWDFEDLAALPGKVMCSVQNTISLRCL